MDKNYQEWYVFLSGGIGEDKWDKELILKCSSILEVIPYCIADGYKVENILKIERV